MFFVLCATVALILRRLIHFPKEVFRKTLHFILLGSVFVLSTAFSAWWLSAAASLFFIVMVYPILALCERLPGYSKLLTERSSGEIKRSLVVVFTMFALLISLCWGLLGEKILGIAAILAWGLGDAAAALVGKRFGRHKISGKYVDGLKSLEGTLAMFIVSFLAVLLVLYIGRQPANATYIPIAALAAAVCAAVELYTQNGMDTLTCPLATVVVLVPLIQLSGL